MLPKLRSASYARFAATEYSNALGVRFWGKEGRAVFVNVVAGKLPLRCGPFARSSGVGLS